MAFSWKEYYLLANHLFQMAALNKLPADEALWRCVVSRAYYAAYNCAFIYAIESDGTISS
jgi:hypothetical protein